MIDIYRAEEDIPENIPFVMSQSERAKIAIHLISIRLHLDLKHFYLKIFFLFEHLTSF